MLLLGLRGFSICIAVLLALGLPIGSQADSQPFVSSTGCGDGQLPVPPRQAIPARTPRSGCCLSKVLRRMKKKVQTLRTAYRAAIKGLETN